MEKEKKTKKEFHTYKKLSLLAIMLILGGILALALALIISSSIGTDVTSAFITGGIIFVACIFVSLLVFKKRKYFCPRCGSRYMETGNYRGTGDMEVSSGQYSTSVYEWLHVEYECPVCKTSKIIVERHKIGKY